jgi:hypothetical protein
MSASDLLTVIVIVTLLVTGLFFGFSYLGRRLGHDRKPVRHTEGPGTSRYFVRYFPSSGADTDTGSEDAFQ